MIQVPGSGSVSGSGITGGATYTPVWLGASEDHERVESELAARSNGPTSRFTADDTHVIDGDDAEDEDIL